MSRMKILLTVLLSLPLIQAQSLNPPPKTEPSFISKMASWMFPFGSNSDDLSTSETKKYYANSFITLPQASNSLSTDTTCNPCNKVPWIPVLANYQQNAIVGFVQPNEKPPPPQYLPPANNYNPIQRVEITGMKPPPIPHQMEHYGPPIRTAYRPPPQANYGIPKPTYGPPPRPGYGPPVKPEYAAPHKQNNGPPLNSLYLQPPKPVHPNNGHYFKMKLFPVKPMYDLSPSANQRQPSYLSPSGQQELPQDYSSSYQTMSDEPFGMKPPPVHGGYEIPPASFPLENNPPLPEYPPIDNPLINYQPSGENQNTASYKEVDQKSVVSSYDTSYKAQTLPDNNENLGKFQNGEQGLSSEESKFTLYVPIAENAVKKLKEEKENFSQSIRPLEKDIFKSSEESPSGSNIRPSVAPEKSGNVPSSYTGDLEIAAETKTFDSLQVPNNYQNQRPDQNQNRGHRSHFRGQYSFVEQPEFGSSQTRPIDLETATNPFSNFISTSKRNTLRQHNSANFYKFVSPIPFPNLSASQVVPLRTFSRFSSNPIRQESSTIGENIQVVPSIQVASYLTTIEHPVQVVQSSLIDINATDIKFDDDNRVSENKNDPVNNTFPSNHHLTNYSQSNSSQIKNYREQLVTKLNEKGSGFKAPPMDYSSWTPTLSSVSIVPTIIMKPPNAKQPVWLTAKTRDEIIRDQVNKQRSQIIIPYIPKSPSPFKIKGSSQSYKSDAPLKLNPISTLLLKESVWSQFSKDYAQDESHKIDSTVPTEQPYTPLSNTETTSFTEQIDYNRSNSDLPFDIIRLQKNIDDWTEQEFSKKFVDVSEAEVKNKAISTKAIPSTFWHTNKETVVTSATTLIQTPTTTTQPNIEDDINNFVLDEDLRTSTRAPTTESVSLETEDFVASTKPFWDNLEVSISAKTKEKVYVVTPLPLFQNISGKDPEKQKNITSDNTIHVLKLLFSEWPHHINGLETTTSTTSRPKPDPFNLANAQIFTNAPSVGVETISGHSKVSLVNIPATEATTRPSSSLIPANTTNSSTL